MSRWLVIGAATVVAFDTLASLAARIFDFDYGSLWPLSVLLAVIVTFFAGRDTGLVRHGVFAGLALEFANSTVGWAVSWLIGPGAPARADREVILIVLTVLAVTASGAVEGLIGGWLGARVARRRRLDAVRKDL